MEAKLVVVSGKAPSREFALTLPTRIGRSRSADIPLNHPLISRQHCELFESDGQLMVRDLGSLNGTYIGENRITEEVRLAPNGLLTVGAFTFRAVYEAADVEEAPDFATDEEEPDADEDTGTIDVSGGAETNKVEAGESEADFNMSWLEDSDHSSPETEEAPESPADLMPPSGSGIGEDGEVAAPSPKKKVDTAAAKPKAKEAAPPKAPAEKQESGEQAGDEEDLDDFFRSLNEP